jgi:uncharacterized protein
MQISRFTVFVDDYPSQGESLAYNTRTQSLVKVNQDLKNLLDNLRLARRAEVLPYEAELSELFQMGIIVKDDADDVERFERFIDQRKYGVDNTNFTASVLTTYSCNFACTYCFEESTRSSGQKLDKPTSDLIMNWIKLKVGKYRPKQFTLNYYGGEPLLNQPIMEYMSAHMQDWCRQQGINFKVNIQTNGALLTPEFLEKHIPLGLQSARISVDGTKEIHDRQRPMRGTGQGTFDIVMKNLIYAVDKIKISVAAGYDKGNPQGILDILDYLDEIKVLRKLDTFMHTPIHPSLGPAHDPGAIVSSECMSNYETDTLLGATAIIKDALRKKGIGAKSGLSTSMCPVTRDGGVTIDTQGLIFKCNSMLGHPELAVGNVRSIEYNDMQTKFLEADAWKKCEPDCPYAPICNTGCRLFGYFKTGDFMAKSCEKGYMDRFIPLAIRKEYDLRMAASKKKEAQEALALSG